MKSGPRPSGNMKSGLRPNGNIKLTFSVKKWKMPTIKPKFSSAAAGNGNMKSGPRPNGNMKSGPRPNGNVKLKFLGHLNTVSFARPLSGNSNLIGSLGVLLWHDMIRRGHTVEWCVHEEGSHRSKCLRLFLCGAMSLTVCRGVGVYIRGLGV
jgi:hypothetical protein